MTEAASQRIDWIQLWKSGDLARFCFISLGIMLHATNETMVMTVMPAMLGEIEGVQYVGWSFAIHEIGSIVAGAAAGRLVSFVSPRHRPCFRARFAPARIGPVSVTPLQLALAGRHRHDDDRWRPAHSASMRL